MSRARKQTTDPATADWRPMLAARPIPNQAARVEERDGVVTVYVPKAPGRRGRRIWRYIMPTSDERRFTLDDLGADLWRLCDGERTVEAIIDRFAEQHRLSFHEARVAVTAYLKQLIQRAVLAVALPPGSAPESEES